MDINIKWLGQTVFSGCSDVFLTDNIWKAYMQWALTCALFTQASLFGFVTWNCIGRQVYSRRTTTQLDLWCLDLVFTLMASSAMYLYKPSKVQQSLCTYWTVTRLCNALRHMNGQLANCNCKLCKGHTRVAILPVWVQNRRRFWSKFTSTLKMKHDREWLTTPKSTSNYCLIRCVSADRSSGMCCYVV